MSEMCLTIPVLVVALTSSCVGCLRRAIALSRKMASSSSVQFTWSRDTLSVHHFCGNQSNVIQAYHGYVKPFLDAYDQKHMLNYYCGATASLALCDGWMLIKDYCWSLHRWVHKANTIYCALQMGGLEGVGKGTWLCYYINWKHLWLVPY